MKNLLWTRSSVLLAIFFLFPAVSGADSRLRNQWLDTYPDACQRLVDVANNCNLCHDGDNLTSYAQDYLDLGMTWAEMDPITDSDQDGISNFLEITADCTLPYDAASASAVQGLPEAAVPATHIVGNNPNPFNPSTTLILQIQAAGPARLEIFDASGRRVRLLHDGTLSAGRQQLEWDGRGDSGEALPSGTYFARLASGKEVSSHSLVLIK